MPLTLPGVVLVQARWLRGTVGDPVINTFAFLVAASGGATDNNIRDSLDQFYFTTTTNGGNINGILNSSLTALTYIMRDADQAAGTPGREIPSLLFVPPAAGSWMPADVAICASYRGSAPVTARKRGRIYLGPVRQGSVTTTGLILDSSQVTVQQACARLAGKTQSDGQWVIASRKYNEIANVVSGYVDEHFDTQRRRDPGAQFFGRRPDEWTLA